MNIYSKPHISFFLLTAVWLSLPLRNMPEYYDVLIKKCLKLKFSSFYVLLLQNVTAQITGKPIVTEKLLHLHKWRAVVLDAIFFSLY